MTTVDMRAAVVSHYYSWVELLVGVGNYRVVVMVAVVVADACYYYIMVVLVAVVIVVVLVVVSFDDLNMLS